MSLGVARDDIRFGLPLAQECAHHGVTVEAYLAGYDTDLAPPYPGVVAMLAVLPRWAIFSNKHGHSGRAELARLGWAPEVALFGDAFGGGPKRLAPVLDRLGVSGGDVLVVGDTEHDLACARACGALFALAGWNPRAAAAHAAGLFEPDVVLSDPAGVTALLRR